MHQDFHEREVEVQRVCRRYVLQSSGFCLCTRKYECIDREVRNECVQKGSCELLLAAMDVGFAIGGHALVWKSLGCRGLAPTEAGSRGKGSERCSGRV